MPWGKTEEGIGIWRGIGRLLGYALVTGIITLMLAFALSSGSNKAAIQLLRDVRNASRATACVLALPVDPDVGRDPVLVAECFKSNGLTPPTIPGGNNAVP